MKKAGQSESLSQWEVFSDGQASLFTPNMIDHQEMKVEEHIVSRNAAFSPVSAHYLQVLPLVVVTAAGDAECSAGAVGYQDAAAADGLWIQVVVAVRV